jgi:hypothetical protein
MPLSGRQQIKPKLKYHLSDYMNKNSWRKDILRDRGKLIPVIATLNLTDEDTKRWYLMRAKLTGTTACLITIGYERQ